MSSNYELLLVGACEAPWRAYLERVIEPLGQLDGVGEDDAVKKVVEGDYDLIIVDASVVEDVFELVADIRSRKLNTRIVVLSASPTWKRARDAFYAGATDYVGITLNEEKLRAAFRAALHKSVPGVEMA